MEILYPAERVRETTKGEVIMKSRKLRNFVFLGAVALMGGGAVTDVSAQTPRQERREDRREDRQERREDRQEAREERREDRQQARRWRVRRDGRNYDVDQRQAELLRQAVNEGYRQGFQEGREDRTNRRRSNYRTNNVYRTGTYGYQSYVDRNLYQYYFQQGFQRGYDDGFSSRFRYGRDQGGSVSILGNLVETILGLQSY